METSNQEGSNLPFTIEQFYNFLKEKKLMTTKCSECGTVLFPPRPICTNCYSKNLNWISLSGKGKLVTYTIVHVAPERFKQFVPYGYGIIELTNGIRLPGMIRGIKIEEIRIGIELKVDFDCEPSSYWPGWPRYYFRPNKGTSD